MELSHNHGQCHETIIRTFRYDATACSVMGATKCSDYLFAESGLQHEEKMARLGQMGHDFGTSPILVPCLWSERLLFNGTDFIIGISARWERS